MLSVTKLANSVIRASIKKIPVLLEHACFISPRRTRFSSWYQDTLTARHWFVEMASSKETLAIQPEWRGNKKAKYSGVSIMSKAKLLMCRLPEAQQRHPDSRKAIVCTRHYRPLKYPGAQSIFFSLSFLTTHIGIWRNGKKLQHFSSTVGLLGNRVFDNVNYYHFWVDVIADVWYIRNVLPDTEWPDYYLVPFAGLPWQWEILRQCGVKDEQVIPFARYDVLSIDKVVIPIRDKGAANLPPWISRALHDMSEWSSRFEEEGRLVFISRADAGRRRIVNEADIRERLVSRGFEVYTLDGLSVRDQQQLFASATIVCAPHGAALTNLVWCRPGALVIDFLSENHLPPCFMELAEQNGVVYIPYVCRQEEGGKAGIRGDTRISHEQIESVLDVINKHAALSSSPLVVSKG